MEQGAEDEGEPPIALAGIERGLTADLALEVVPIVGDAVTILLDFSMMKRVNRTARRCSRSAGSAMPPRLTEKSHRLRNTPATTRCGLSATSPATQSISRASA